MAQKCTKFVRKMSKQPVSIMTSVNLSSVKYDINIDVICYGSKDTWRPYNILRNTFLKSFKSIDYFSVLQDLI